jgi:hypothetical protein
VKTVYCYYVHGFTVHSEIECPELLPGLCSTPDVRVRYGSLGHIPLDEQHPWKNYRIGERHMLLNYKDVGRFSVRDGAEIIVDPSPGADAFTLRQILFGSAFGCIIHQRNLLPLHANAFLHKGGAVLVLAQSGTGKSTLAATMKSRGYKILADDVCAVKASLGEEPVVYPGIPQLKLWRDAADFLGEDIGVMRKLAPHEEKYVMPTLDFYCDKSLHIKTLYILNAHDEKTLGVADMTQIEKVCALQNHTYRKGMVAKLGIESENLKACAALVKSVRMRVIYRPKTGFLLNELADLVEKDLQ